jgi:hypothetical protein
MQEVAARERPPAQQSSETVAAELKFNNHASLLLEIVESLLYPPFVSRLPALRISGKVQV